MCADHSFQLFHLVDGDLKATGVLVSQGLVDASNVNDGIVFELFKVLNAVGYFELIETLSTWYESRHIIIYYIIKSDTCLLFCVNNQDIQLLRTFIL